MCANMSNDIDIFAIHIACNKALSDGPDPSNTTRIFWYAVPGRGKAILTGLIMITAS